MSDFSSVEAALRAAESGIEASECHGILCGVLCAQRPFDPRPWVVYVLGTCDPENAAVPEAQAELGRLAESAVFELNDPEFSFQPLLPSDEESLQLRTLAVSQWCQGFVEGLRLGGVKRPDKLSGDAGEIVRDLMVIGKASRFQVEDTDDNEADFAELVEYLRAAVRLVYEELQAEPSKKPPPRKKNRGAGATH